MKTVNKLTIVALLATTMTAHAGENLGAIDVNASTDASTATSSSHAVTVIDRQQIERSKASDIVDILKGVPGVVVSDTSGVGAKSRVDLGGFGETSAANVVVLIDGRRVNSPDLSGTDWTQIPLDQIERIEVMHGGGATLYGDGAVGGAINIVTRIPASGGRIRVGTGSFGSDEESLRIGADSGRVRVESNISAAKSDGYRQNSLFERVDAGVRAESELSERLNLRMSGNFHRDRAGLPGPLTAAQMTADRKQSNNPSDFARTDDSFADAGLNWMDRGLEFDLSGGVRDRTTHAEYVSFGSVSDIGIRTFSLRPKLAYAFDSGVPVSLLAGASVDESRGMFAYSGAFPLPTTNVKRRRSGYFGQATVSGSDNDWRITAGLRSEGIKDTFSQGAINIASERKTLWDLGGSMSVAKALQLRLSAGSSVRFPLLDERYSFFSGTVDAALKSQTGNHYAAALRYEMEKAWLELSLSRADLTREIFYNPIGFGANENYSDKTRHDVAMLSGHVDGGELLQFGGNITYANATFRGGFYDGKKIPAVAAVRAGADWQADWSSNFNSLLKLTWVGKSYLISDQANVRPKLPAYLLLDVAMSYRLGDAELYARVDNLTNEKYSSYGVYSAFSGDNFYPAAGIGVRAGASYRF